MSAVLAGCGGDDDKPTPDTGATTDAGSDTGVTTDAGSDAADTFVSGPVDLQIDTYNVALAGAAVAFVAERRPLIVAELGKLAGDIACLQEVWQETDKVAIAGAMKANYPYSAWPKTDRSTKVDATPAVPTTAPCAGLEKEIDAAVKCLTDKCSIEDRLTTTADARDKCLADVAALLGPADKSCYSCLVSNMVSEKLSTIPAVCKAPGLGLGFGGQASPLLLSKHTLTDVTQLVVPGCWQQRSVVRATATLPNGAKVDVYCNHLSPVNDDELLPNSCPWNGGETATKKRWEAEQKVQIDAILAWAKASKNRVIFLGDLNASPAIAVPPAEGAPIQGYGAYVLDSLGKVYVEALAAGYVPKCTFCKTTLLTGGVENTWLDHIYLGGVDKSRVKSTLRTFDTKLATPFEYLSDHFGLRAVVTFDP
ncbi:MAG: endonuclease/exonuclease/phosphatase family protein [Myxococcales bacterium]|nr:endonuclease/exonuclease/phosphatase family protein [Myxococcales bacterium]